MLKAKNKPEELGTQLFDTNGMIKDGLEEELAPMRAMTC